MYLCIYIHNVLIFFTPGGFINVDDLLSHSMFLHFTLEDIKRVVTSNDKQRFSLRDHPDSEKLQICANQGHSFPVGVNVYHRSVMQGTYCSWSSASLKFQILQNVISAVHHNCKVVDPRFGENHRLKSQAC